MTFYLKFKSQGKKIIYILRNLEKFNILRFEERKVVDDDLFGHQLPRGNGHDRDHREPEDGSFTANKADESLKKVEISFKDTSCEKVEKCSFFQVLK